MFDGGFEMSDRSYPGEAVECASQIADVLAPVVRLAQISANLTDAELTAAARSLAVVMQRAEAALVAVTADAIERGAVHRSTAADATQWVQRLSTGETVSSLVGAETASLAGPMVMSDGAESSANEDDGAYAGGMEPSHAARVSKLADACLSPLNRVLRDAVVSGAVNTTVAKTALDHTPRVTAVLPDASRDEVYGWYLSLGPGAGAKAVRELTRRIVATYGEDELDRSEDTQQAHESLSWTDMPDGMVRLVAAVATGHRQWERCTM